MIETIHPSFNPYPVYMFLDFLKARFQEWASHDLCRTYYVTRTKS
ncbi:hypothetical protein V6Z11_A01G103600 [Gossypium hirsutum]